MSAFESAFEALRKTVGDVEADRLLTAVEADKLNEVVETLAATRRSVEAADGMELAEELVRGMVAEDEQRQVGASVAKLRRTLAPAVPRCNVTFVGGGQCAKAAGHRTPENQDPHTPAPPVPDNTTGDEGEHSLEYVKGRCRQLAANLRAVEAERDGLRKRAIRAVHKLKSPAPSGSQHYRSGWDDGLEAAIDAISSAAEGGDR